MAQETDGSTVRGTDTGTTTGSWRGGVVAGVVAGAVMGLFVSAMNPPTLRVAIPALYGFAGNGVAGWTAHLSHGAVFGVVFVAALEATPLSRYADRTGPAAALGVGYGVVLWVIAAGLVMPLWLGALGAPVRLPLPNLALPSLLWHAVYGVVLGAASPSLREL
ncbi:MAG: histidine kinase [Halobacteriaceae archaeon]